MEMPQFKQPDAVTQRRGFFAIACTVLALFAVSWPIERSFDLWVFKDRGNLLNLDYLLDRHIQLGTDAYYSYGLLPVLIQRLLFMGFGRGSWPLIMCHFAFALLMATAWWMIVRQLSEPRLWTLVVIVLCPMVIWINPNFPYVLVQLSMMFSLVLALRGKLPAALAVSAVGCWSVPTITLLFSAGFGLLIFLEWRQSRDRSPRDLIRMLAPGTLTYLLLGLVIAAEFGWRSMLSTALPFQGMAFYRAVHYGMFTSLRLFLFPGPLPFITGSGSILRYYLCDHVTWWLVGTLLLFGFGIHAAIGMVRQRRLIPGAGLVTLICAATHLIFIVFAYGTPGQHTIYDPILAAGVVIGLSTMTSIRLRNIFMGLFVLLAAFGSLNQFGYTRWLWRSTHPSEDTANFYTHDDFRLEWSQIVNLSKTKHVFLLSYGTGMHHYYPTIDTADSWTVQLGQVFNADKERVLAKMRKADIVVEDMTGPMTLFDTDDDIKRQLSSMCLVEIKTYFIVWSKTPPAGPGGECKSYHRELPADLRRRGEFSL